MFHTTACDPPLPDLASPDGSTVLIQGRCQSQDTATGRDCLSAPHRLPHKVFMAVCSQFYQLLESTKLRVLQGGRSTLISTAGSTAGVVTSSRAAITNSQYLCRRRLLQSDLQAQKQKWASWYQWNLLVLVVTWERCTELTSQTEEWEKRKLLFIQQQYCSSRFIADFFLPARPFVPSLQRVWRERGKKDIQAALYKSFFPQISQTSLCGCKGSSLALWNGHCLSW